MKSDHHTCLSEHHLDDIMRIMIEGHPLSQWDPSGAIQLWWQEKQRRSVGDHEKHQRKKDIDEGNDTIYIRNLSGFGRMGESFG